MTSVPPCPYFDRLATTLIGVEEDDRTNPVMPSGQRYADVVLKRFFIGAVARLFHPGCRHDWMPVFIGSQNCGKSSFFSYITPPDYTDEDMYPLGDNGSAEHRVPEGQASRSAPGMDRPNG